MAKNVIGLVIFISFSVYSEYIVGAAPSFNHRIRYNYITDTYVYKENPKKIVMPYFEAGIQKQFNNSVFPLILRFEFANNIDDTMYIAGYDYVLSEYRYRILGINFSWEYYINFFGNKEKWQNFIFAGFGFNLIKIDDKYLSFDTKKEINIPDYSNSFNYKHYYPSVEFGNGAEKLLSASVKLKVRDVLKISMPYSVKDYTDAPLKGIVKKEIYFTVMIIVSLCFGIA